MRISGTGITPFVTKTKPDFRIATKLAISWTQVSNGNWVYVDRGSTVDAYETEVTVYGLRGSIEQLASQMDANRAAGSNVVTLSLFNANEKIFGADVVYTDVSATLLGPIKIEQTRLKSFSTTFTLRALSPTFTGSNTFPSLKYVRIGYDANVPEYTINKLDSYTGSYQYLDMQADAGIFEGTFQFTDTELKNLRRYMATLRGTTTAISSIAGVTYPFGVLRGGYPKNVKVLALTDEEQRGIGNWYAKLRLAEVIA